MALLVLLGAIILRAASPAVSDPAFANAVTVPATDKAIHYFGRIGLTDPSAPRLWWPGSGLEARFTGTDLALLIGDTSGNNEYTVVLDGDVAHAQTVHCAKGDGVYGFPQLGAGDHKVLVVLQSETWQPTWFNGLELSAGGHLDNFAGPTRKIEFYGDSITCGYGNQGDSKTPRSNTNSDNFLSYDADTARALHAEYRCIARSGIAITTAWNADVSTGIMMPNFYDRLDPAIPHSWDFKLWTPDAVVINLGENDSGIYKLGHHPDPGPEFDTAAYKSFVAGIRTVYPNATIFCVLGPMDAVRGQWKDFETKAVQQLTDAGDKNIYFLPLDTRKAATLSGSGGHPNVAEDLDMADLLTPFIQAKMGWN